jgi:hypothetical protein
MEKQKLKHGGSGRGQGRKPIVIKQQTYSFRCYPCQIDEIRKLIKNFKENELGKKN